MMEKDTIPQAYWENSRWGREHATELHQQYEDVWIAIADKQVVAVGSDPIRYEQKRCPDFRSFNTRTELRRCETVRRMKPHGCCTKLRKSQ